MAEESNRLATTLAVLVLAVAAAAGLYFVAQAQRPAAVQADIRYAPESDRNKLDIYLPAGDGPFPFVIDLHGGGFVTGDKAEEPVAQPILDLGVAIVRVNYRLAGEGTYPASRDDVLAAVDYLRATGPQYSLDPTRFALWGQSAGAFLAVAAGLDLAREGYPPRAIIDFYGPVAFGQMDADMAALPRKADRGPADAPDSPESTLLGFPIGGNRAKADAVGPLGVLADWPAGRTLPPLMIRHGDGDTTVSPLQAGRLRDAWVAADPTAKVDFSVLQGEGHGTAGFSSDDQVGAVAIFLAEHLQ